MLGPLAPKTYLLPSLDSATEMNFSTPLLFEEEEGLLEEEPPVHNSPLIEQPHCLVTPHIAWAPLQARKRCMQIVEDNIRAFQQGHPQNVVNP